jgi:hypothetical protein
MVYSKYQAVFAAESRVILAGKRIRRHRDDACKIHAIKNKFIFVSVGASGFESAPGSPEISWSAYDEPGKLVDQIPDTADDPVNLLAQLWGQSMEQHLNRGLAVNPEPLLRSLRVEGAQELARGVFAGRTKRGQFVIFAAVLNCDCTAGSKHAVLRILPISLPDRSETVAMGMKQATTLVGELFERNSERARMSIKKFAADHAGAGAPELLGAAAVAGLEFVLEYADSEDIGGPIDAVEMTSTGDIHWIRRKVNCPDQR